MRFSKIFSFFLFLILGAMTNLSGQVACAYVDTSNNLHYFAGTVPANGTVTWTQLTNPSATVGIKAIALSPDGKMLGVGTDAKVYYSAGIINGNNPNWVQSPNTFNVLGVAIFDNNFFHFNTAGNIYYFSGAFPAAIGENAPWTQLKHTFTKTSLVINPAGQLLQGGTNGQVYFAAGVNSSWMQSVGTNNVANSANAIAVGISNNSLVHINSSYNVYYSSIPTIPATGTQLQLPWVQIDGTAKAISMSPTGQMLCIGTNNTAYYSAGVVSNKANWVQLPGTANAVGVAISTAPTAAEIKAATHIAAAKALGK